MAINYAVIGEESLHKTQSAVLKALDEWVEPDPEAEGDDAEPYRIAMSPSKLSVELNEPLGNVSYHMSALAKKGWIVEVRTEAVRGAVEHFYSLAVRVDADLSASPA